MKYTQEDLANAIAVLSDADLDDHEIDQIDEIIIGFAEEKLNIEAILDAEQQGEIDEESADAMIAETITTHAEKRLQIFDLEIDLLEENYSNSSQQRGGISRGNLGISPAQNQISFSQAMGTTISNLINHDYKSPQSGKSAIASATGLSISDIDRIILGQAVPDTNTANAMTACFSATREEAGFKEFMSLASQAQQEVAQFTNSNTPVEVVQNSSEINSLKAEFNALKQQQELGNVLRSLEKQADSLVSNGNLTPWEKKKLFGETLDKEEGLALFSAACEANGVNTDTQLDRITYYLSVASDRGQVIQFSSAQEIPIEEAVDPIKQQEADEYFKRNGFG